MRLVYYLVSPSCVVSAERDMQLQLRLTGRPVVQFPVVLSPQAPCNVRPTHCNRALSTRAFGHPTCWPVRSFLPVPTGLSISLGNCRCSLLLSASGELDLHSLTSNLFLICKTPITAGHTMTPVQFRPNNNPIQAPSRAPSAPPTRHDPFCSPQQLQKTLLLAQHQMRQCWHELRG